MLTKLKIDDIPQDSNFVEEQVAKIRGKFIFEHASDGDYWEYIVLSEDNREHLTAFIDDIENLEEELEQRKLAVQHILESELISSIGIPAGLEPTALDKQT